jgi:pyrroline-5-carboxylate reductase
MKVLVVGAGNMGKTYLRGFMASRFIEPSNIYVLSRTEQSLSTLPEVPVENKHTQVGEYISQVDIIIIAVKPQDFPSLSEKLAPYVTPSQLVLSIMAGITISELENRLHTDKIVRAMPNLPSQTGMGMTVFTASAAMDRKDLFIVQNLINTTGKSVYVENESMIDAATAVSGSGPAYVYFFMQAMIDAAQQMGFTQSQAELLVNQTFLGAVLLQNQSNLTCNEWVEKVASRGGTTEAALSVMKNHNIKSGIEEALHAALQRSRELGK